MWREGAEGLAGFDSVFWTTTRGFPSWIHYGTLNIEIRSDLMVQRIGGQDGLSVQAIELSLCYSVALIRFSSKTLRSLLSILWFSFSQVPHLVRHVTLEGIQVSSNHAEEGFRCLYPSCVSTMNHHNPWDSREPTIRLTAAHMSNYITTSLNPAPPERSKSSFFLREPQRGLSEGLRLAKRTGARALSGRANGGRDTSPGVGTRLPARCGVEGRESKAAKKHPESGYITWLSFSLRAAGA